MEARFAGQKTYECEGCERQAPCVKNVESYMGETSQCCVCRSFDGARCEDCEDECTKCHKVVPVEDLEPVEICTAERSWGNPAEYETGQWCKACREKAERKYERQNS